MKRRSRASLLILCLCLSLLACGRHKLRPDEIERNRIFAEILEREDHRTLGSDRFFEENLENSPYVEIRQICAIALGRIGDPRALPWLYKGCKSAYVSVRAASAFALGEAEDRELLRRESRRADPRTAIELRNLLEDPALEVRMRATEALGKVSETEGDAFVVARKLEEVRCDGSPASRAFADLAITALMRLKIPATYPTLHKLAGLEDPEIQWRAANALIRLRDKSARSVFLRLIGSPNADVQAHAALGIGICEDPALAATLLPMLPPRDTRTGKPIPLPIRFNAVRALGMLKSASAIPAIEDAIKAEPVKQENPDQTNFCIAAAASIGNIGAREGEAALVHLLQIPGPAANSAIVALSKILKSEPARFFQRTHANEFSDPPALRAWAQALGELGGPEAITALKAILLRSAEDHPGYADALAVPGVISALAKARTPDLAEILKFYFASHDGVVLRAVAEAYKPDPKSRQPWAPILQAYAGIAPGADIEAKVSILDRLEPWLKEPEVRAALQTVLQDRSRNARIAAAGLLRKAGVEGVPDYPGESEHRLYRNAYAMIAGARKDRTVAIIETSRGSVTIDLFREDAPVTVANFAELAGKHFFDGLTFMRVVPFFVVQSGDPRNDQEGGPGHSIRCEINTRPFERGSVGMALAGKDTGGSQFFITLAPQPHLDGGYTCFGRVISGMQVVEQLVPGDRIMKVAIEDDVTTLDYRRY